MKVDIGFWDKDGEYIEQIEELTMEEEIITLEEENKRLKREYDILDSIIEINSLKISELKEENKRLQAENEQLKEENSKIIWDEVCTTNCSKYKAYNKYSKALEEIREHVKGCCHKFSSNHKDLCFGCEYDKEVCDYSVILDKINEVLDERN